MGAEIEQQAAMIIAPHISAISVTAITTSSARVDLSAVTELGPGVNDGRFVTIQATGADAYFFFNNSNAGTADSTMTSGGATPANRTFCVPAGSSKDFVLRAGYTWLVVVGSASGFVRAYLSSIAPHQAGG